MKYENKYLSKKRPYKRYFFLMFIPFIFKESNSHYWHFFEAEIMVGNFIILEYILRLKFSSYDSFRNSQ